MFLFLIFFFLLQVSKLSSKRHRPRIMGLGSLLIAVGGFVNAVPHLLNAPYRPTRYAQGLVEFS